jgi:excisionase family DNA binding protein
MTGEIQTAFRKLVRTIFMEVLAETSLDLSRSHSTNQADDKSQSLLLNSRDAAEALSISEPHLSRLTRSGIIPHVRVGKCLRYSIEALQNWIRQSESTESSPSRSTTSKKLGERKTVEKAATVSKTSTKPRSKTPSTTAEVKEPEKRKSIQTRTKTRQAKQRVLQSTEKEDRRNPFAELLAEVGIDRSSLPSLTNGELMRISETDLVTYHGWMYLNRPLPEEAREKLKKHVLAIVSGGG